MRAYLSRWVCLDVPSNLARAEAEAAEAARGGARLVVFPESFLAGYTRRADPARARETFGRVSSGHPEVLFLFGSISEEGRNRMTAWCGGREVARYDKVHLFAPNAEQEIWTPGDRYAALKWGGVTWGLINCNDVRFPEQARALKLRAGADALLAVAWWPWRRDGAWAALLRARAIENACVVAGCCVAASEVPGERFAGAGNYVFGPSGEAVPTADDRTYDLPLESPSAPLVDPVATAVEISEVEVFRA